MDYRDPGDSTGRKRLVKWEKKHKSRSRWSIKKYSDG